MQATKSDDLHTLDLVPDLKCSIAPRCGCPFEQHKCRPRKLFLGPSPNRFASGGLEATGKTIRTASPPRLLSKETLFTTPHPRCRGSIVLCGPYSVALSDPTQLPSVQQSSFLDQFSYISIPIGAWRGILTSFRRVAGEPARAKNSSNSNSETRFS